MAERRAAGFNIPLNFYDGAEVNSIPKRVRAAAIGVWALAGDYSATQLTDGYVGPEMLRTFGCTPPIRAALKATTNSRGEHSPLWEDARDGGVQLTNWPKWQRTRAEVTTYRASEAERKKAARDAKRNQAQDNSRPSLDQLSSNSHATVDQLSTNCRATVEQLSPVEHDPRVGSGETSTSSNAKTSARTPAGRPQNVRSTKTETKTETKTKSLSIETSGECVTSGDARDEDTHTDQAPPRFCDNHPGGTRDRCGDCANARAFHAAWTDTQAVIETVRTQQAEAERRRRRELIDACLRCDDFGRLDDLTDCNHQEERHA